MINSTSTRFRAVGSASVLALTVGLGAGMAAPALAQSAPEPATTAPTPNTPVAPANAEECAIVAGVITCAPGTDADGFFDVSGDPVGLDVQDGAVVQGPIIALGAVTGTVDGAIITSNLFEDALLLGLGSDVTINGTVQTSGPNSEAVETEDNSSVTNNGTLYTTGGTSDGIALAQGSDFTNNGLIVTEGGGSEGVFAFSDNVTVINSVTGSIFTSGTNATGIAVQNDSSVTNDGLVQTFGFGADGVTAGDDVIFVNTGNIVTGNNQASSVVLGNNASASNSGLISTDGDSSAGLQAGENSTVNNSGSILTAGPNFSDAVVVGVGSTLTNSGTIAASGDESFGVFGTGDGITVTNTATGEISADGLAGFGVSLQNDASVTNNGDISTSNDFSFAVDALDGAQITNNGSISTAGDQSVAINVGEQAVIDSNGTISTEGTDSFGIVAADGADIALGADNDLSTSGDNATAIVVDGTATLSNAGSISTSGDGAQAVAITGDATVTNSGSISADLARALIFGGATDLTNTASGSIFSGSDDAVLFTVGSTLTNNGSIEGEVGVAGSADDDQVVNFGSIVGNSGDAALLGDGADEFQQWTGATVTGNIDLEEGDDTFILEGSASSVDGTIFGGAGTDLALIAGLLDADNFSGFENFQIGSTLGGTLNDAVISGDRTLMGDVSVVGGVTLGLGADSLTSTGTLTLEDGSTVTIETPLDFDLLGQTVTVFEAGTTFANNGATINIIDDDLLIDYLSVLDGRAVEVISANPLVLSDDGNIVNFGNALQAAVVAGTLSDANFDILNGLTTDQLETAALDSLPSLSYGAAREIFETSSAASDMLNRHLAGDQSGIWGEFIWRGAEQEGQTLSQGGYESDQKIFTVGGDIAFGGSGRLGVLASYADIENDDLSNGAVRGQTDIESIKVGAYVGYDFGDRGFFNGEVAYLTGDIGNDRDGLLGPIASDFDFDGWAYRAVLGFDLASSDRVSITPSIGLNGAMLNFDDAVESGGFGFTVARDDVDYMELRGALEIAGEVSSAIDFYARGTYIRDLEDDAGVYQLTSAELGTFDVALPLRDQNRVEAAAGAVFGLSTNATVEVGYLGDFADDYDAHSAQASVRINF